MQLLDYLSGEIKTTFKKHPHQFFTEHDIHTQLALIATRLLEKNGSLYSRTSDGYVVSRLHHEYPTPFRCLMKGFEFELITEEKFREEKKKNPGFRARRGFLDFVIINAEYISSNKLSVVSAKRYRDLQEIARHRQNVALDLAVEVVYYPTFDERLHDGIMDRRVTSTLQDHEKLVALMEFKTNNTPYCGEAAMMFFSNTKHKGKLNEKLADIQRHEKVALYSIFDE
jgi:hypothetical protein